MEGFSVETALICDEARIEANGKYFLIGVYTGDVVVASTPVDLLLTGFLILNAPTAFTTELNIRAAINGTKVSQLQGTISAETGGAIPIQIPAAIRDLKEQSVFSIMIQIDNGDWHTVVSRLIVIQDEPGSSE